MSLFAVVDSTSVEAPDGLATIVAGLSLLERSIRLAAVCGADEIAIRLPRGADPDEMPFDPSSVDVPVSTVSDQASLSPAGPVDTVIILDAAVVFDRSMVNRTIDAAIDSDDDLPRRDADAHLAIYRLDAPSELKAILQEPRKYRQQADPRIDGSWSVKVDSADAAQRAARRLWTSCRKPQDGLVSRFLNRHISISISRLLAPTWVAPNHISVVTFSLGIAAAISAAWGGYLGFLIAGILYQTNSVVDGVDGELARVRYEFSFLGEWLDTISDDMSDFLLYIGLGIGAWRTMPEAPGPWGSELWLGLGIAAAVAKLASMTVYYRWLIANGRGDLLSFQWSFDDDNGDRTPLARALSVARYFFRKDFIVFVAMVMSLGGVLPYLLFAFAPGNATIALSVILQQLRGNPSD